eukprot:TRINITY_DN20250_c0_g1_i1.p1 TRINITY_DN20250_c0_g1~~TRINITY_DN20250_c0_g1_i1.p1  ORF type:complete len:220 (-),score=32.28 TRINITY_DN20250_c0_g1_i1:186-845(-)
MEATSRVVEPVMPASGDWERKSCQSVRVFLAAYDVAAKERDAPLEVRSLELPSQQALATSHKHHRVPTRSVLSSSRREAVDDVLRNFNGRLDEILKNHEHSKASTAETRSTSASTSASRTSSIESTSRRSDSGEDGFGLRGKAEAECETSSRRPPQRRCTAPAAVNPGCRGRQESVVGSMRRARHSEDSRCTQYPSLADAALYASAAFVLGFGATRCLR